MSMIYPHHHPALLYRRRPSSAHPPFLGLFLKNLFFLAAAWFAASIAIRIVVLTLSILFSPPVFVLLLLTCVSSWWSFDVLRQNEHSPFVTTSTAGPAFGGRCQSRCSSRRAERRREFCHRFQQQCQSQRQQVQSFRENDNETKPSSAANTEDSKSEERSIKNKERLNKFQPKRVFNDHKTHFHIKQDDQHVTLSIDVPGYSVSGLNIRVDQDGTLTIAGERQNKIGDSFAFQRQFVLSPTTMDTTSVTANVADGLLTITIDKKEIPKPRLITITTEAPHETDRDETEGPSEEEEVEEETSSNNNKQRLNNFQPRRVSDDQRTPFHIKQDEQHVTLSIDVPGYSVSDLSITVDQDGTLTIAGERQNKIGDAFAFQRQFVLSPTTMDTTSVTASVVDGLLTITIDKKEIPKPRLITITTEVRETDRDETEGPSEEEEVEEETIVFEKAPAVKEDILLSTSKKPIVVETVNDEDEEDVEIEESDPVEEDYDSWENVIKA